MDARAVSRIPSPEARWFPAWSPNIRAASGWIRESTSLGARIVNFRRLSCEKARKTAWLTCPKSRERRLHPVSPFEPGGDARVEGPSTFRALVFEAHTLNATGPAAAHAIVRHQHLRAAGSLRREEGGPEMESGPEIRPKRCFSQACYAPAARAVPVWPKTRTPLVAARTLFLKRHG